MKQILLLRRLLPPEKGAFKNNWKSEENEFWGHYTELIKLNMASPELLLIQIVVYSRTVQNLSCHALLGMYFFNIVLVIQTDIAHKRHPKINNPAAVPRIKSIDVYLDELTIS